MKLEIDLANREEVGAAIPMLQLIYDGTLTPAAQLQQFERGNAVAQSAIPLPPAPSTAGAAVLPIAHAAPGASSLPPVALGNAQDSAATGVAPPPPAGLMTPAPAVDLDSKGLPWDERIHASTKSKIASGEWKAKRGADAALIATVEAELRARVVQSAIPLPIAAPGAASVPSVMTNGPAYLAEGAATGGSTSTPAGMDPAAVFGGAVVSTPLPPVALPVASSVPAPTAAPSEPVSFEQLMPRVSAAVMLGTLPADAIQKACAANGVGSVVLLHTNPQFVPLVWATLKQAYPALA